MIKALLSRAALYYCRDLLLCEREAAIINRNTLLAGRNGILTPDSACNRVVKSLELQIVALEALLDLSPDD